MGKFNEYSQKATPEDADSLMIYDATSKANKLSPFSGIWNWIVGKLTNAVINNLQTSNKTVLGAINELNSNSGIYNYAGFQYSTNLLQPYISKSSGFTAPSSIIVIGYEGISLLLFITMNVGEVPYSYVNITGNLVTKTSDGTIAITTVDRNRQITIISSRTVIISVRAVS